MSERAWLSLPTSRKLEQPSVDPGYVGTVGPLRRANEKSLKAARRHLREIPEADIEGTGRVLVEKATGEEYEVIVSHVDLVDPKASGAVAFCVRDGLLVPLRRPGWQHHADASVEAGEIGYRVAGPKEPMPMPEVY